MNRITVALEAIIDQLDSTLASLSDPKLIQGEPDTKVERSYFQAQRRAYVRALAAHGKGTRATYTGMSWTVPSSSRLGLEHRIVRQGEVLLCDCEAAALGKPCVHKALVEAYEQAGELADRYDDAKQALPFDPTDDRAYADMLMLAAA